jgi:lysophospholipase L1-like esterase
MSTPRSYVALGDSFTEGLDDPAGDGTFRGWADRVAERLAREAGELHYANLAVRGRKVPQIAAEQVPAAVALRPELVSFAGGTNDLLRRECDVDQVGRLVAESVRRLREAGAQVVVVLNGDPSRRLPWARRLVPRITALNERVRRAAHELDARVVELWDERVFDDPRLFSVDRLHLNGEGHRRIADAVLEQLGLPVDDWRAPLPPAPPPRRAQARVDDLRWMRSYAGPWLHRRLTGRSSGDGVVPKRPALAPWTAPADARGSLDQKDRSRPLGSS